MGDTAKKEERSCEREYLRQQREEAGGLGWAGLYCAVLCLAGLRYLLLRSINAMGLLICLFLISTLVRWGTSLRPGSALPVVLLIDPVDDWGSSSRVIEKATELGVGVVKVFSKDMARAIEKNVKKEYGEDELSEVVSSAFQSTEELRAEIERRGAYLLGVLCESDTGLSLAEVIGTSLLPTVHNRLEARRDKFLQQSTLRSAGLDSVQQILTSSWDEARAFFESHASEGVVIKPPRGSASIGVAFAASLSEAEAHFAALLSSPDNPGFSNNTAQRDVLVQEFVKGREFAIDTVSRDGEHKVVASWKYKKEALNGAPFVYFCSEAVDEKLEPDLPLVHDYVCEVLDALKVKWGPCHVEVKIRENGSPVLVEANVGRWHGQDFHAIVNICLGQNAVDLSVDALVSSFHSDDAVKEEAMQRWRSTPPRHRPLRAFGRIVHLSSHVEGTLVEDGLLGSEEALFLHVPSLFTFRPFYRGDAGEEVKQTIDLRTAAGYAVLISQDKEQIEADYAALIAFQKNMFEVQPKSSL